MLDKIALLDEWSGFLLTFSLKIFFSPDLEPIYLYRLWIRSFENSYISENPRTPKPLTFSKNRLRGATNRSNLRPVAIFFFSEKTTFFFKNFAYVQKKLCICACFKILFQKRSNT
ncbi:hypothetical protein LXL04_035217 [Taraxacum kok-saghyz]